MFGMIVEWRRSLVAYRMRMLAMAIWAWWFCLGAWPALGTATQAAGLGVFLILASAFARGKPWWPDARLERIVIACAPLLAVNAFVWQRWQLSPRLSFLSAFPLLWTPAYLAVEAGPGRPLWMGKMGTAFAWLEARRPGVTVFLLGLFNAWFTAGAILRMRSMNVDYWDLGSIGQAMANCARGRGFVSTDPAGFADTRFAQHFEALFAALSPVMLWPHGAELMASLQVLAVSAAAVFLGSALERITARRAGYWLGLGGLCLHPAIGFPLWADFHGDVFAVLPLSALLWALAAGRTRIFWIAFAFAACCSEYAMAATSGIALMLMYLGLKKRTWPGRGIVLLTLSSGLFGAGVWVLMPMLRSPGALSVISSHPVSAAIANPFSLANLCQALIPCSGALLLSPVLLLGAFPNLLKDMLFGMDIGTHHFAPAVPVLFTGLAFAIRDGLPAERRTRALAQAGVCALLAALLWGPVPFGPQGWKRVREWRRSQPVPSGKAWALASRFDPNRNRIVTGSLAGTLFDSPRLGFLGSTYLDPATPAFPPDADIVLELWDQGFPAWAPWHRMLRALPLAVAGRPDPVWVPAASGVLWLPAAGKAEGNAKPDMKLDKQAGPEPAGGGGPSAFLRAYDSLPPVPQAGRSDLSLRSLAGDFRMQAGMAYALVALKKDGGCLPLGIGDRESGWIWFSVRAGEGFALPIHLQLREAQDTRADMPPVKRWRVRAESGG